MAPTNRSLSLLALFAVATGACPTRGVSSDEVELQTVEVRGSR